MRISKEEVEALKKSVHAIDPDAKLFLFGGRLNDDAKTPDIDILIQTKKIKLKHRNELKDLIEANLPDQTVHTMITKDGTEPHAQMIKPKAVKL